MDHLDAPPSTDTPSTDAPRIAGIVPALLLDLVRRTMDSRERDALVRRARWFEGVARPDRSYPTAAVWRLFDEAEQVGLHDPGYLVGEELLRHSMARGTCQELLCSDLTTAAERFVRRADRLWPGQTYCVTREHADAVTIAAAPTSSSHPAACRLVVGFWQRLLEVRGGEPGVRERRCVHRGADSCSFAIRSFAGDGTPATAQDNPAGARLAVLERLVEQLAAATDVPAVTHAIASHVDRVIRADEVWVGVRSGDTLVWSRRGSAGTHDGQTRAGPDPSTFDLGRGLPTVTRPLTVAGTEVGRLHAVIPPANRVSWSEDHSLDVLAAHASAALERVENARMLEAERDWALRLAHASTELAAHDSTRSLIAAFGRLVVELPGVHAFSFWDQDEKGSPACRIRLGAPMPVDQDRPTRDEWRSAATPSVGVTVHLDAGPDVNGMLRVAVGSDTGRALAVVAVQSSQAQDERFSSFFVSIASQMSAALRGTRLRERAEHDRMHDELTGLCNRDGVEQAAARLLGTGERVALLLCDLDQLKVVNESLGHHAGDEVLRVLAQRMLEAAPQGATLARFGGDEFAVLVRDRNDASMERLAHHVLNTVGRPAHVADQIVHPRVSIGIATATPADTFATLLARADAAVHRAKSLGGNSWARARRHDASQRITVEADLHDGLARAEFDARFQPVLDTWTNEVVGVEALMRWRHAGQLLNPSTFLAVAEQTGVIVEIDRQVRHATYAALRRWNHDRTTPITAGLNLSNRDASDPSVVGRLARELEGAGVDPAWVEIELTERLTIDQDRLQRLVEDLHAVGCRVAIDDFGTGTNSLSRLHELPVDTLKIDRSFLVTTPTGLGASPVLHTIVGLARRVGAQVVAEGIETPAQLDLARTLGVDRVQGWFHSPAVDGDSVERLLAAPPASGHERVSQQVEELVSPAHQ